MAGGTLNPEFYNEKLNLGVLLAPVAGWSNQSNKILRFESQPEMVKLFNLEDYIS